ncbi:MAG: hypothetical protein COV36_02465 [Alphaproteobacteria bacterium CG11_big_fil_rev_8_21_14_0_20_44_7]|nr:MAG: hypothetical protein COV36_02465 [Alphaproteobacteria bacterium CG11_big_fil_rev_8_21_14_0_20_44_7]
MSKFTKKLFVVLSLFLLTACPKNNPADVELAERTATLKRIAENIKSQGDVQTAAQLEAQIISLNKHDAASFLELADSLNMMGQKKEAAEVLETGEKLNPEDDSLKFALAKAYINNNKPHPALEKIELVVDKENRDYFNIKGVALDLTNKPEEAQKTFQLGLDKHSHDDLLLNNLALSYVLDDQYQKAIDILEGLAQRSDAKPKYKHNLALAYGLNKQEKLAYQQLISSLTREDAEENLKFYKEIRKQRKAK